MKCSCGDDHCEPTQIPDSRTACMTCGQPYGNHCIRIHSRLQWDMDRMRDPSGWRAKALTERKIRMDQMGWEEPPKDERQEFSDMAEASEMALLRHSKPAGEA